MNDIKRDDVLKLRELSGFGLMDCKTALQKCSSIEAANQYLQIKGLAVRCYKFIDGERIDFSDNDYIEKAEDLAENEHTVWCDYCQKNVKDAAKEDGHLIQSSYFGSCGLDTGYSISESWVQYCPKNPKHQGMILI